MYYGTLVPGSLAWFLSVSSPFHTDVTNTVSDARRLGARIGPEILVKITLSRVNSGTGS